ncbi:MAG: type II toxin-antitoxin system HicB family antitoxin [Clostridia bacterium]|nr:type II toxin-antitoxin system HicB family antitoxin [Clostridia bacterium]
MKKFIYPIVLFSDKTNNSYTILFPDLDIVACGDTVEEAYTLAEDYLKAYLEFANKMEATVPDATKFEDALKLNPQRFVLLADAEVGEDLVLTPQEETYKNFVEKYLVDAEE